MNNEYCRFETMPRTSPRGFAPTLQRQQSRPPTSPTSIERRTTEPVRNNRTETVRTPATESNSLATLCAYRRARGLCFKCGERWGHDHTCPATIQMHVLEELLDFVGVSVTDEQEEYLQQDELEETALAISLQAFNGNDAATLIQLSAKVQNTGVSVLVDSGSSTSFINARLTEGVEGISALSRPARVKIANGAELLCSQELVQYQWSAQGHQFATTLKILPLGGFDIILGMDWLEQHNPDIDWITKQMTIQSPTGPVVLQG